MVAVVGSYYYPQELKECAKTTLLINSFNKVFHFLFKTQFCFSDGENTANCVTLKPSCHLTFNKTEWKTKNSRKKAEEIIHQYNYPILKIIEFELAQNESTSVIVLTKIKENDDKKNYEFL